MYRAISPFPTVFSTLKRNFCYLHQIKNCCMPCLSVRKTLKFVGWEKVKMWRKRENAGEQHFHFFPIFFLPLDRYVLCLEYHSPVVSFHEILATLTCLKFCHLVKGQCINQITKVWPCVVKHMQMIILVSFKCFYFSLMG